MKALLLLSHGSRRQTSSQEMMALAKAVGDIKDQPFDHVDCAFLQLAKPAFDETLDSLTARGVTHLVVFPLFLAAGSHVSDDVPQMIEDARARYPGIKISLTPHLGQIPDLAAFLMEQATRHG